MTNIRALLNAFNAIFRYKTTDRRSGDSVVEKLDDFTRLSTLTANERATLRVDFEVPLPVETAQRLYNADPVERIAMAEALPEVKRALQVVEDIGFLKPEAYRTLYRRMPKGSKATAQDARGLKFTAYVRERVDRPQTDEQVNALRNIAMAVRTASA